MKQKYFFLFLIFSLSLSLYAEPSKHPATVEKPISTDEIIKGNQLSMLDDLIEVTKLNLEMEKQLKQLVQDYLDTQNTYLKNQNDQELTITMVKKAYFLLEKIKEANLLQAFDSEFIGELNFFSQIAVKRGIPSPS